MSSLVSRLAWGRNSWEREKGWQLSLRVHTSDHVVQFSRLGVSLGFTLSETRLGDL